MKRVLPALLFVLAMIGCGPQPDPTSLITKARIIGVDYSVRGDETRTEVRPGETLDMTLLLTQKEAGMPASSWAFIVCRPAPSAFGIDFCDENEEPLTISLNPTPTDATPGLSVEVPEDFAGDSLLVVGALCMGGAVNTAVMDADVGEESPSACAEGAPESAVGQLVTATLSVIQAGEGNRAPSIEEITINGETWTATFPQPEGPCDGLELPVLSVSNSGVANLEVVAAEGSRETYVRVVDGVEEDTKEDLPVAFYASERGIGGLYSVIDADPGEDALEDTPIANIDYDPAAVEEDGPSAGGRLMRFEFVMSDGRGGMDRATRAACLVP